MTMVLQNRPFCFDQARLPWFWDRQRLVCVPDVADVPRDLITGYQGRVYQSNSNRLTMRGSQYGYLPVFGDANPTDRLEWSGGAMMHPSWESTDIRSQFTAGVLLWVDTIAASGARPWVKGQNTSAADWYFRYYSSTTGMRFAVDTSQGGMEAVYAQEIPTKRWVLMTGSFDGTPPSGDPICKLYIDGVFRASATMFDGTTVNANYPNINIGSSGAAADSGRTHQGSVAYTFLSAALWEDAQHRALGMDPTGGFAPEPVIYSLGGVAAAEPAGPVIGSVSEAATADEAMVAVLTTAGGITEAAEASETLAGLMTTAGALSAAASADATYLGLVQLLEAMSAGATADLVVAGRRILPGAITEGASAADNVVSVLQGVAALSQGALADEQVAGVATMLAAISEAANAGDTVAASILASMAFSSGATADSTFAGEISGTVFGSIAEGAEADEAVLAVLNAVGAFSANANAAAALAGLLMLGEAIAAGSSATEAMVAALRRQGSLPATAATAAGAFAADQTLAANFAGAAAGADIWTGLGNLLGQIGEDATAGAAFLTTLGVVGALAGDASASSLFAVGLRYVRAWSEAADAGDTWAGTVLAFVTGLKQVPVAVPLSGPGPIVVSLAESVTIKLPLR